MTVKSANNNRDVHQTSTATMCFSPTGGCSFINHQSKAWLNFGWDITYIKYILNRIPSTSDSKSFSVGDTE